MSSAAEGRWSKVYSVKGGRWKWKWKWNNATRALVGSTISVLASSCLDVVSGPRAEHGKAKRKGKGKAKAKLRYPSGKWKDKRWR